MMTIGKTHPTLKYFSEKAKISFEKYAQCIVHSCDEYSSLHNIYESNGQNENEFQRLMNEILNVQSQILSYQLTDQQIEEDQNTGTPPTFIEDLEVGGISDLEIGGISRGSTHPLVCTPVSANRCDIFRF